MNYRLQREATARVARGKNEELWRRSCRLYVGAVVEDGMAGWRQKVHGEFPLNSKKQQAVQVRTQKGSKDNYLPPNLQRQLRAITYNLRE